MFIELRPARINLVFQRHGCEVRKARLAAVPLKNKKSEQASFPINMALLTELSPASNRFPHDSDYLQYSGKYFVV